jgi:hypothetical protein
MRGTTNMSNVVYTTETRKEGVCYCYEDGTFHSPRYPYRSIICLCNICVSCYCMEDSYMQIYHVLDYVEIEKGRKPSFDPRK